ncbi:MAG: pseudouridine synthase [Paracoccaceae bacterium]|nr:pseudouridine synthase [Paracoccaceae bacterium]
MQRIAKILSRAGIASRRQAEKLIFNGSISVNGLTITDPSFKVAPSDKIAVNGKPVNAPDDTRLWRYHKPVGLVTTNSDEKGRTTIYDKLPLGLPRLMSIGRLDITSEGLILLTNDGTLKRNLELPSAGFVRKYRVRANGIHNESSLDKLRAGILIDGEKFRAMEVTLDRIKGTNVWYNVVLTEGRNREIRRGFDKINMKVNRLIRISFGEFELGFLPKGEIEEVPITVVHKLLNLGELLKK